MAQEKNSPDLMTMIHGFWGSRVLFAGQELGIYDLLARGGKTADEVARELGLDPDAAATLLGALAGLGLLRKDLQGRFTLAPETENALVAGQPGSLASIIAHMRQMWEAWGRLDEVLRRGRPEIAEERRFVERDPQRVRAFIAGMAEVGRASAEELARRLAAWPVRRMLDIGGGPATYCLALARLKPELRATLFDRPLPLEVAREFITAEGLEERVLTQEGDALTGEFGADYDLVLISQVLHSFGPEDCARVVREAARALAAGGWLIVNEFALNEDRVSPPQAALFSVNMLANTEKGRAYTRNEIKEWMRAAGLGELKEEDLLGRSVLFYGKKG